MPAYEMSEAELNQAMNYVREQRRHRARLGAQALSGAGAVASGREGGAAAFAARDPYPNLMTAQQKRAELNAVNQQYGQLQQNYYTAGLDALTQQYVTEMGLFKAKLNADAQLKAASAQIHAAGMHQQAARLENMTHQLAGLSQPGEAFLKGLIRSSGVQEGPGGVDANMLLAYALGGEALNPAMVGNDKLAGVLPQPGSEEAKSLQIDGARFITRRLLESGAGDMAQLDPKEAAAVFNDIAAVAAVTGTDVQDLLAKVDRLNPERAQTMADGSVKGIATGHYEYLRDTAIRHKAQVGNDYEQVVQQLGHLGAGKLPSWEEVQAQAPTFLPKGEDTDGDGDGVIDYEGYDPQKQLLPGLEIVPESDALDRYVQIMDAIEAHPEHPPVVEAREYLLNSSPYTTFKKQMGYQGADDRQVLREYARTAKKQQRARRQDFRERKRQNIKAGLAPGVGAQPKRPGPSATAEVGSVED